MTERRKLAGRKMLNCRWEERVEEGKLEWFSFREQEFRSEVVMKKIKRAALQLPWNLEILITCKNYALTSSSFSFFSMGDNIIERENFPVRSKWILTTIYCIFSAILSVKIFFPLSDEKCWLREIKNKFDIRFYIFMSNRI